MRVAISGSAYLSSSMLVELSQIVEHLPACRHVDARWIREIQHRIARAAEFDSLVLGGQKTAAPQSIVERLIVGVAAPLRHQCDERRQILILRAQAIRQPGSDARPPGNCAPGLKKRDRRVVINGFGEHRLDETKPIDDASRVRQEFADPGAALPVLGELVFGGGDWKAQLPRSHAGEPLPTPDRIG